MIYLIILIIYYKYYIYNWLKLKKTDLSKSDNDFYFRIGGGTMCGSVTQMFFSTVNHIKGWHPRFILRSKQVRATGRHARILVWWIWDANQIECVWFSFNFKPIWDANQFWTQTRKVKEGCSVEVRRCRQHFWGWHGRPRPCLILNFF